MRGISWVAENRLASQEGLCSLEYTHQRPSKFFSASVLHAQPIITSFTSLIQQYQTICHNNRVFVMFSARSMSKQSYLYKYTACENSVFSKYSDCQRNNYKNSIRMKCVSMFSGIYVRTFHRNLLSPYLLLLLMEVSGFSKT